MPDLLIFDARGSGAVFLKRRDNLIYLDNAATAFIKPQSVYKAVENSLKRFGGNAGRSSHKASLEASKEVFSCRETVADMFGGLPENTVFTYNATYALNIAIKSVYTYGSHILISDLEHNSVLRPVAAITKNSFASYSVFDSFIELDEAQRADAIISSIRTKMKPLSRIIVCTARSNVCGAKMPIREIGRFCRKNGLIFIVDAAQSAGFDDIDIERDCIDILCAPAHKGLYGIMGCGFLIFSEDIAKNGRIGSVIEGGSGVNSLDITMPDTLPEKLEGGTLNNIGISALKAGAEFIQSIGTQEIRRYESELISLAYELLSENPSIEIYCRNDSSILLFNLKGISSEQVAALLDKRDICVRAGYHCAPLAHSRVGTPPGGAVRMSVGRFNTVDDIRCFSDTVNSI